MTRHRRNFPKPVDETSSAPFAADSGTPQNKYTEATASEDFQKKAGVPSDAKEAPVEAKVLIAFKPEDFVFILDVYAAILSFIFASALKSDFVTVHTVCKFDREQRQALAEALCPVVAKYFPEDWIKYLPEIRLGMMLAAVTGGKFQQVTEVIKQKTIDAEKAKTV